MAKLYLKFEQNGQVLKEVYLSQAATTIGRLPDNSVQIDNLAVSGHHARITLGKRPLHCGGSWLAQRNLREQ